MLWYRRRVPKRLCTVLGRREILTSLATRDRRVAAAAAHRLDVETDEMFAAAEARLASPPDGGFVPGSRALPDREALERAVRGMRSALLDRDAEDRLNAPPLDPAAAEREAEWDARIAEVQARRWGEAVRNVDDWSARGLGIALVTAGVEGVSARDLERAPVDLRAAAAGEMRAYSLERAARARGEWSPAEALRATSPPEVGIARALDLYLAAADLPRATEAEWRLAVRQFIDVCGDVGVATLAPPHVAAFREALLKLPKRLRAAERQLPLPELVRRYEGMEAPRLSPASVRKRLAAISAILVHAQAAGLRPDGARNPVTRLLPKKARPGHGRGPRRPFEAGHLEAIFASPFYRGAAGPERRIAPGPYLGMSERRACRPGSGPFSARTTRG